jgi:hypothetical protein
LESEWRWNVWRFGYSGPWAGSGPFEVELIARLRDEPTVAVAKVVAPGLTPYWFVRTPPAAGVFFIAPIIPAPTGPFPWSFDVEPDVS